MAEILSGYDERGLRDILYERPDRLMDDYISERLNDDRVGSRFSDRFRERAIQVRDRLKESRLYRSTLAATRRLKNRGRVDAVQQLLDIGATQNAPRVMQRYVMANKLLRSHWQRRQAAGYEDGYSKDRHNRNCIGDTHDVYRIVTNGYARKTDEGYRATTYYLTPEERDELKTPDRLDVLITWATVEESIWAMADDPSSQYNASL